jgi:hypothetical protein
MEARQCLTQQRKYQTFVIYLCGVDVQEMGGTAHEL